MSQLTVNRLSETVTLSFFGGKKKVEAGTKNKRATKRYRVWYNKRSPASLKRVKELIKLIYESNEKRLLWLTLTTQQNETKKTDKDLLYCIKKFFQHELFGYLAICERQRNTGDLHFHVIITGTAKLDIQKYALRWAKLINREPHPAQFDIEYITDIKHLHLYISKYVTKFQYTDEKSWQNIEKGYSKYGQKYKAPYNSLFECRTFTHGRLPIEDNYKIKIPSQFAGYLCKGERQYNDFTDSFKYNENLLKEAIFTRNALLRAGLIELTNKK